MAASPEPPIPWRRDERQRGYPVPYGRHRVVSPRDVSKRDGGVSYCETLQASPNRKVLIRSDLPDVHRRRRRSPSGQYTGLDAAARQTVLHCTIATRATPAAS